MVTVEQIKELAHTIWEQEGRPEGKHGEHYFRAKQILGEQESSRVIKLAPPALLVELAPPPPIVLLAPMPSKRKRQTRSKKK